MVSVACCAGAPDNDNSPIIYSYTREQAIEDGILVPVGSVNNESIVFTTNLYFSEGFDEDEQKRKEVIKRGLELLQKSDAEDTEFTKLRVIEQGKIWVIHNAEGYTFLKPDDY